MTDTLTSRIVKYFLLDIGKNASNGITYTLWLKDDKGRQVYQEAQDTAKLMAEQWRGTDLFKLDELENGYIIDLDFSIVASLLRVIGGQELAGKASQRRVDDILGLSEYINKMAKQGKKDIDVILYSFVKSNKIYYQNKYIRAYQVRHWDISSVNMVLLSQYGLDIVKTEPISVLPNRHGVLYKLRIS